MLNLKKIILYLKNIINLFKKEELVLIILILVLISLSYLPLLWQFLSSQDRVFLGSYGFPPDFFGNYISFQQGRLGHFARVAKITSTIISKPSLIRLEYVLLGQLSRIFPLPPMLFFHLTRLILSLSFLLLTYLLISKIFKKKSLRLSAFVLAFFSTSVGLSLAKLINLWSPLGVFERSSYYHHYLFSFCFLILSFLFLTKVLKTNIKKTKKESKRKVLNLTLALLFGFLTSFIHPPVIIIFYLSFPFYLILNFLKNKDTSIKKPAILTFYVFITSLPLLYLYKQSHLHPWNLLSPVDLNYNLSSQISFLEFVIGVGPTLILSLLGSFFILKNKKENTLQELLIPWSITYILGFFLLWKLFRFNSIRFLQTPFFIFLGILSTIALNKISEIYYKKNKDKKKINQQKLIILATIFIISLSLPSLYTSFKLNSKNFNFPHYSYIYADKEKYYALNWLCKNTKEKDIVLSSEENGVLIAAFCGNFPYLSIHAQPLPSYNKLKETQETVLNQIINSQQACDLLKQEKINYIFLEKKGQQNKNLNYSCLKEVFKNSQVVIYKHSN